MLGEVRGDQDLVQLVQAYEAAYGKGTVSTFDFPVLPHWELGPKLGLIDFERGVKISGTRFYVLRGAAARLQRGLIAWMIDLHTREHGYTEVYPPCGCDPVPSVRLLPVIWLFEIASVPLLA